MLERTLELCLAKNLQNEEQQRVWPKLQSSAKIEYADLKRLLTEIDQILQLERKGIVDGKKSKTLKIKRTLGRSRQQPLTGERLERVKNFP